MRSFKAPSSHVIALVFWLLAPALSGAQPAPGPDQPVASVDAEILRSQLDGIEASPDFDAATKAALTEMYRMALSNLETARSHRESAARFLQAVETAPTETRLLQAQLADKKEDGLSAAISFAALSLEEIDQRLQKEKANLAAVQAQLAQLEAQLKKEADRPAAVRELLA